MPTNTYERIIINTKQSLSTLPIEKFPIVQNNLAFRFLVRFKQKYSFYAYAKVCIQFV